MFYSIFLSALGLFFMSCGGSDDGQPLTQVELITSSGNVITMTGTWQSPCVSMDGNSIEEVFTFDGMKATINIDIFSGAGCQNEPVQRQIIELDITGIGSTYTVDLAGSEVTANPISGTETNVAESRTDPFKQAFYIDDSGEQPALYHGIFEDDGGPVNASGFPLQLHNIAIVKQQ